MLLKQMGNDIFMPHFFLCVWFV